MQLRVFSVNGVSSTKKSNSRATSASSALACMRSKPATARGAELTPMTCMPNALHFGASASAIAPTPKMPTVLLCRSCAGKRCHCRLFLRTDRARQVAGQSQHRRHGGFGDRRTVNAVNIGDDHVLAQARPVDEVVRRRCRAPAPISAGRRSPGPCRRASARRSKARRLRRYRGRPWNDDRPASTLSSGKRACIRSRYWLRTGSGIASKMSRLVMRKLAAAGSGGRKANRLISSV